MIQPFSIQHSWRAAARARGHRFVVEKYEEVLRKFTKIGCTFGKYRYAVRENYVPVNRYSKHRSTGTKNTSKPKLRSGSPRYVVMMAALGISRFDPCMFGRELRLPPA